VRKPLEAAEAYLNICPHKEHPGVIYKHLRPNWEVLDNATDIPDDEELDWVDVKVGKVEDLDVRHNCVDEPILWAYYYQTSYPKLIGECISFFFPFDLPLTGGMPHRLNSISRRHL
jgi:hypothetical protein